MTIYDLKIEVRLLGGLLATTLGGNMFIDALRVLSQQTVTSRVAYLSSYPTVLALCWAILAMLVLPYFLYQAFNIFEKYRSQVTRLACWSVMAGGVIYAYMGYLSKNLDYKFITEIFIATSITNIAMAAVLAYGLNTAQRRAQERHT